MTPSELPSHGGKLREAWDLEPQSRDVPHIWGGDCWADTCPRKPWKMSAFETQWVRPIHRGGGGGVAGLVPEWHKRILT